MKLLNNNELKKIVIEDVKVNFGNKKLRKLIFDSKFRFLFYFRVANYFYNKNQKKRKVFYRLMKSIFSKLYRRLMIRYCCDIKIKTQIGKGLHIPHPIGIVINGKAKIGNYCTIMQQVTIGNKLNDNKVPIIGDNVFIGAGVKILGDIKIGNNVIIGANAVVTKNIPDNCIVAGIPAKVIKNANSN